MRREVNCKTAGLAGTSELTVLAPIKKGLIPALDAVTYKTRVKRVLKTLHLGRTSAHEHELARVMSDAVERVGRIHSVTVRVLEPEDQVMLSVIFDGAWEAYVRVIWQKVTRLLDLIFCNTEGYVPGWENSYADWSTWLRKAQRETAFFYATPGLTVADTRYLRMQERQYRRDPPNVADLNVTRLKIPSAEDIADQAIFDHDGIAGADPSNPIHNTPVSVIAAGRPAFRHGMRSLAGLHRLVDWHPPATQDGVVLHRAAHELLPEFVRMLGADGDATYQTGIKRAMRRFDEAIRWLQSPVDVPPLRIPPMLPANPTVNTPQDVQGGIVTPYPDIDHGCLLMLAFSSPGALALFLSKLQVTQQSATLNPGDIAINIALTAQGLRQAGLPEAQLRLFPDEFVRGMDSRAGLLGDLRINHPRRWRLPMRNWGDGPAAVDTAEDDAGVRVGLDAVHALLQLRHRNAAPQANDKPLGDAAIRQKIMRAMSDLVAIDPGVVPLSLQWMHRIQQPGQTQTLEHFGFADALADPVFEKSQAGRRYSNQVHLGEVLCGYPNQADHVQTRTGDAAAVPALLRNGSFLVVRKLRQDIEALELALLAAVKKPSGPALPREALLSRMMGRWPSLQADGSLAAHAGEPLADVVPGDKPNDFHFDRDASGSACPFHAHMRRANPRDTDPEPNGRPPRIVRRGMSYGPVHDRTLTDAGTITQSLAQERGLVFMAYNASIGEQFEVVQRWLTGGNSSGSYSGQSDPFVGLAEPGQRRYFRFEQDGATCRIALDGDDQIHAEQRPFVRLEWGAYFFAPSLTALGQLQASALQGSGQLAVAWDAAVGVAEITRLRHIERHDTPHAAMQAWKGAVEDPEAAAEFKSASIWAAIRAMHGGVLRTPIGVLVADRDLVNQVLTDATQHLTANGYLGRMRRSFGGIFLGLDAGQADRAYERESAACTQAIMALDADVQFQAARQSTHNALQGLVAHAMKDAADDGDTHWDLTIDLRELIDPLLADFCESWFGLSTAGELFARGGNRWDWQAGDAPLYPGHFMAPSRYFFQPHPGSTVEDIGAAHGQALLQAMTAFLAQSATAISARSDAQVARAVLGAGLDTVGTFDFSARTLVGAIMGFVPTIDGNLRRIANEWLLEGALWSLRASWAAAAPAASLTAARARIGREFITAMQLRAAPELLWRTATTHHTLGNDPAHQVLVQPGDLVIAALVSATQQHLASGPAAPGIRAGDPGPSLHAAFGGDRWAAAPRPTHACPGSHAAMGVMLGFFSALVESPLRLRAGPGSLSLSLDGLVPVAPASAIDASVADGPALEALALHDFKLPPLLKKAGALAGQLVLPTHAPSGAPLAGPAAAPIRLVGIGDSWLSTFYSAFAPNLLTSLASRGCTFEKTFAGTGWLLNKMASDAVLKQKVVKYLTDLLPTDPQPQALILGGGGNDLVDPKSAPKKSPLYRMLNIGATNLKAALISDEVDKFIDGELFGYYQKLVEQIQPLTTVPILVHAYDHPVPDGRAKVYKLPLGITFGGDPWLQPVFIAAKIPDAVARDVMIELINRLNGMLDKLQTKYPSQVFHVNLCGTLAKHYGSDHTALWTDELHPNQQGFDLLADEFMAVLATLKIV